MTRAGPSQRVGADQNLRRRVRPRHRHRASPTGRGRPPCLACIVWPGRPSRLSDTQRGSRRFDPIRLTRTPVCRPDRPKRPWSASPGRPVPASAWPRRRAGDRRGMHPDEKRLGWPNGSRATATMPSRPAGRATTDDESVGRVAPARSRPFLRPRCRGAECYVQNTNRRHGPDTRLTGILWSTDGVSHTLILLAGGCPGTGAPVSHRRERRSVAEPASRAAIPRRM